MKTKWIVVANKARAIILAARDDQRRPLIVEVIEHPEGRLSDAELKSDGPGQSFDSRGVARHVMQPKETPVERETRAFVKQLAKILDTAGDIGKFDQLVLVCSHQMLGELRRALQPKTATRVVLEAAKDIAKWSDSQIVTEVGSLLAEHPAQRVD